MSLVEIMIAIAITSALGYGVMKGVEWKENMSKTSEFRKDTGILAQKIFDVLKHKDGCINTFNSMDATATTGITQIRDRLNNVVFDMNTVFGKGVKLSSMELNDVAGMDDGVKVEPGNVGTTNLVLKFQAMASTAYENREVMEKLKIRVQTDSGAKIISCYSVASGEDMIWRRSNLNPDNIYYNGGAVGVETSNPSNRLDVLGWIRATTSANEQIAMGTFPAVGPLQYQFLLQVNKPLDFWNVVSSDLADVKAGNVRADQYIVIGGAAIFCGPGYYGKMVYDPSIKRIKICESFGWKTKKMVEWCLPKEFNKDNDDEYMNFKQSDDARRIKDSACQNSQRKSGTGDSWDPDKGRGGGPPKTKLTSGGFRIKYDDDSDPCKNDQNCQNWRALHQ